MHPKYDGPGDEARRENPPKICVAIATKGRAPVLARMLQCLENQTLLPSAILVVCTSDEDVAGVAPQDRLRILKGRAGLPAQRNVALENVPEDTDVVAFFDDDFIPANGWLAAAARCFEQNPTVAGLTGDVVADGIKGPAISVDQALDIIAARRESVGDFLIENFSPYGCNMAFRWAAARDLRFDERLVLYGWQEDRDFGAAVAQKGGRIVKIGAAYGVHLGAKSGRSPGRRLGYSQIANPLYLVAKGTMSFGNAVKHIICNFGSNAVRSLAPEPEVDRCGRLVGNLIAFRDMVSGRLAPERAESV